MFELGDYAIDLHKKVGEEVFKNKIDILFCAGENAKYIYETAINNGLNENNAFYFQNKEDLLQSLKGMLKKGDVVIVKASNGMKFYDIAEDLKKI